MTDSQPPAPPAEAIINASAGSIKDQSKREEVAYLLESAVSGIRINFAEGNQLAQLAEAALARGCKMIVAGGGDGTISAVAGKLAGTGVVLGVLPLGTLNHFAKDLGIGSELGPAIRNLGAGSVREVDVGEVNGRIFLNNSGLGLYPQIVEHRENLQKRGVSKWMAAAWAAVPALVRYRLLTIRARLKNEEVQLRTPIVFVGNNQYEWEGLKAGTRARLDAGQLCLYLPHPTGRFKLLTMSVAALLGKLHRNEEFDVFMAGELQIETKRQRTLYVTLDGEVTTMSTPLHYKIQARSLRVLAPQKT